VASGWLSVVGKQPVTDNRPQLIKHSESGFTLLELIITLTIIAILVAGTVPFAHNMIKREKEMELRRNLREIRKAIESFHNQCQPMKQGNSLLASEMPEDCYPQSLEALVEGYEPPNPPNTYVRFLRRVPIDPFTGRNDSWGLRSTEDDPFSTGSGKVSKTNGIFDVFSTASGKALDGTEYSKW
jgi:general secretion pathway protein G